MMLPATGARNPHRLYSVRVSWFTLITVFGGIVEVGSSLTGIGAPVQIAARLLLVGLALTVFFVPKEKRCELAPPFVRVTAALLALAAVLSSTKHLLFTRSISDATDSFLFMYGIGFLILLAALVPLSARFRVVFFLLTAASLTFGLLQLYLQELLLPRDHLAAIGLLYETFANDRIRVVSFFRSAPRFAEFLTLLSLLILVELIVPRIARTTGRRTLLILAYCVVIVLLYNTYSRAGYVLFLSSSLALVLLIRRKARDGRGFGPLVTYSVFFVAIVAAVLAAIDRLPFDRTILDTTSYLARQSSWSTLAERLAEGSLPDLLLGFGESARFAKGDIRYFVVDNLLLSLLLYGGLVALASALLLTAAVTRYALSVRKAGASSLEPWIAFLPCLWLEGLFVDNHNTLFIAILTMIGIVSSARLRLNEEAQPISRGSPSQRLESRTRAASDLDPNA